jgi:hypothetical protein
MVMAYHSPISNVLVESQGIAQQATFGSPVNGAVTDMRGFDGIAALAIVPVVVATGTWQVYLQMADDAAFTQNVTTIADASTGALAQSPAASTATGYYWVEAYRPPRRYVRVVANPLVAAVTLGVVMFRYKHTGLMPVSASDSMGLTNRVVVRAA